MGIGERQKLCKSLKKWWPGTESNCRHGDFQTVQNNNAQQSTTISLNKINNLQ